MACQDSIGLIGAIVSRSVFAERCNCEPEWNCFRFKRPTGRRRGRDGISHFCGALDDSVPPVR